MRPKRYETAAEKQAAYRLRKAQEHHQVEEHPPVISGKFLTADPEKRDPKIWDRAVARAGRAKRYAEKMPAFVGPKDLVFQDPAWQYERELRFAKQFTH